MVNPRCHVAGESDRMPPGWRPLRPGGAATVWVTDPVTALAYPYRLGPVSWGLLTRCRPGTPPPADLPPAARLVLALAGILVDPAKSGVERRAWQDGLTARRGAFRQRGYAPVPGLLPPLQLGALRLHYRWLVRQAP